MSEHIPHLLDADVITFSATATITGGQVVEITGNMSVGPAGAASTKVVGVAGRDAINGGSTPVYAEGVHDLTAAGAIAAGDLVKAGAAGTVATIGAGTFDQCIGRALEAIADTAKGRVLLDVV